jgi:KDO2-lipid IV(A) lauroyltransferase
MATAHVGNWELLGLYLSHKGYPLCPLVKVQENPFFDKIVQAKRESIGMKTISRTGFLRPILKAFQRNEIVPFIMDQYDYDGTLVNFFGRLASFPKGSAEFSHKIGTPIIYMYIFRETKYRYHIVISKAFEPLSTGDMKADIQNTTAQLAKMIEDTIEKHPSQWLWMHKLWKKRHRGDKKDD